MHKRLVLHAWAHPRPCIGLSAAMLLRHRLGGDRDGGYALHLGQFHYLIHYGNVIECGDIRHKNVITVGDIRHKNVIGPLLLTTNFPLLKTT